MSNTTTNFISVRIAAQLAGCSPQTIFRMIEDGTIRATKIGKRYKLDKTRFQTWLDAGGVTEESYGAKV